MPSFCYQDLFVLLIISRAVVPSDQVMDMFFSVNHFFFLFATNGPMLSLAAKLKDLGNSVLGRFGMSVDNFKAVKDPNTGSYSIQFQK
jgi:hypothetical protein